MIQVDELRLNSDIVYRFEYLAGFIGFGDEDKTAIYGAAKQLGPLVPALVDAVYEKLFEYDVTKRHFLPRQSGYDGPVPENLEALTLDHEIMQFRKKHLGNYLVALVTMPFDGKMVAFLNIVGNIHTTNGGSDKIYVPLIQMNALLGYVADILTAFILELGLDRVAEKRTVRAFGKLLWIQNDFINRHYMTTPVTSPL